MWAYKLDKAVNHLGMTRSAGSVRAVIVKLFQEAMAKFEANLTHWDAEEWDATARPTAPANTPAMFDANARVAQNMARSLGWDGTIFGELQCFLAFAPEGHNYGFVLTQATSGHRFVVSPVPMPHLEEHIDWDAHISVDETAKMRAALEGAPTEPPPLQWSGGWKTSRAGNQYCFINGAQVTVFAAREGGFKAVIASQTTNLKVFTRAFSTQMDCAAYVVKHFYTLVKDWGYADGLTGGVPQSLDNPFADIDWGSDDA